jgi:hypothetical protein
MIPLGGEAGSAELREWATRELRGYGPDDELPEYRWIVTSIHADMAYRTTLLTGQPIIPRHIPREFRDDISGEIPLRMSITEIEEYARRSRPGEPLEWLPPHAEEAALAMNEYQQGGKRVKRLYRRVDPVSLHGVVDQVRTTLTWRHWSTESRALPKQSTSTPTPTRSTSGARMLRTSQPLPQLAGSASRS